MDILIEEFETKLDSFDIYSIYKEHTNVAFLDSNRDSSDLGRYSFIGINPFCVLKGSNNSCLINDDWYECDAFDKLSQLIKMYESANNTDIPFIGGCIGYFSYDFGLTIENVISNSSTDLSLPHFYFVFYDNLIIFDNLNQKKFISSCGMLCDHKKSISKIKDEIGKQNKVIYQELKPSKAVFSSNFSQGEYVDAIKKMREYIRDGDMYIANMTQRFTALTSRDSYDIYKDLRKINPAPFSAFMRLEDFDIISSSPERFIKIHKRIVQTRPIKGTRPRGKTPEEDEIFKNQLLQSEKDKSELLMIVDLERNDLSKICKPNHVKVTELFKLEEYSTVFHLVSTIVGELKDHVDSVQCIKACFPGGSITGTPKIRAMEIIDEIEGIKRGLYTGCLGYFSFDGNADFNIIIRTIIKKDNNVYFGVGGGITWDSNEEDEYQETLDKAKALVRVV